MSPRCHANITPWKILRSSVLGQAKFAGSCPKTGPVGRRLEARAASQSIAISFTNSKTLGHDAPGQSKHTGSGTMTHGNQTGSSVPRSKFPRTAFVPGLPQLDHPAPTAGPSENHGGMMSSLTMTVGCHSRLPHSVFSSAKLPSRGQREFRGGKNANPSDGAGVRPEAPFDPINSRRDGIRRRRVFSARGGRRCVRVWFRAGPGPWVCRASCSGVRTISWRERCGGRSGRRLRRRPT